MSFNHTKLNLEQWILASGAIFALTAVLLGAFAAHGLKNMLDTYSLDIFKTAAEYQMHHAIGLLIIGVLTGFESFSLKWLKVAAILLIIGILIFCGSLFILAVTQIKWLGAITPIGGVALLAGWSVFIFSVTRKNSST